MKTKAEPSPRATHRHVPAIVFFLFALPVSAFAELLVGLTLDHDGRTRSYDLAVPGSAGDQSSALILDLHGLFLDKTIQRGYSGFDTLAEQEGFFVAFPDAVNSAWNVVVGNEGVVDDVGFLRALVAHISSQYDIDPNRIYASGHSRGGGMVLRLACEAADFFAAFSTVSITITEQDAPSCKPGRPVPIITFHGLNDGTVPYDGDGFFLSAPDSFGYWRDTNNCAGPVDRQDFGSDAWCDSDSNCGDDVQTIMCAVTGSGNGHVPYNNTAGLDLAEMSWDFFRSFTLQGASPGFQVNSGLNDAWVSVDAPLQGFFFTVFPEIEFFFLSWFTFDSEPPVGGNAIFGAIDQRWVTGGGTYSGDTVTVNLELTSGGAFNTSVPMATQTPGYGTITIVFTNCNEAVLDYLFPSLGLSGQMTLTRALTDNVSLCEEFPAP